MSFAEGEDLGDGVVGEVKLADDTPDAGSNHRNDKDEAKAAGSKSSVDEDYKAISRKAGNPPVINTKERRRKERRKGEKTEKRKDDEKKSHRTKEKRRNGKKEEKTRKRQMRTINFH